MVTSSHEFCDSLKSPPRCKTVANIAKTRTMIFVIYQPADAWTYGSTTTQITPPFFDNHSSQFPLTIKKTKTVIVSIQPML